MNRLELFKKMLPGILPLLVFIVADEIWGTKIGLLVALGLGIGELGYYLVRYRKLDKFILLDVGLLLIMGGISIALDNALFFKLKPALIGLILCLVLALSAFSRQNLLLAMSKRYMKDMEINAEMERKMRQSTKVMFWIFLFQTLLTVYAAFYLSDRAWALISGVLFYVLFGLIFLYELFYPRIVSWIKYRKEEWLPLLNENGQLTGKAPRSVVHSGTKLLHPVVHLHLINEKKQIYLQKRPHDKLVQPGKWDTAVGGHISFGEKPELALERETLEEIGLKNLQPKLLTNYKWESEIEREWVFMYVALSDQVPVPDSKEVDEGKFWGKKEIELNLQKNVFTPSFEHEYKILKKAFGI